MNSRRFVNLVSKNWADGLYSLSRIDSAKHLFYKTRKDAQEANDERNNNEKKFNILRRLPDPVTRFDPAPVGRMLSPGLEWFELFSPGISDGRVVYSTRAGETSMFDAHENAFLTLPSLYQPKGTNPVSFSITHPGADLDGLYVMDRDLNSGRAVVPPGQCQPLSCCFEVLEYRPWNSRIDDNPKGWSWRLLVPPPFVQQPGFEPSWITSYTTMVDADKCSTICISSDKNGTYCFRTACLDSSHRLGWSHLEKWEHVGNWALPFEGRAEYVPEFNLWFGFTASRFNHLCAVDLSAMDQSREPTVEHVWEELSLPEEDQWTPHCLRLIYMGYGRFCVAKSFVAVGTGRKLAVLTGIEMVRDKDDQSLQIVKHKCIHYVSTEDVLEWVL